MATCPNCGYKVMCTCCPRCYCDIQGHSITGKIEFSNPNNEEENKNWKDS